MFTIGNVARRVGVRPSAIRYYETQGILKPAARRSNGYRIYDEDAVNLLKFVRRAQTLGITLKEVRKLLDLSRQGQQPCEQVKELARYHLHDIDLKMRELRSLRKQLQALLGRRSRRVPGNTICPLIEQVKPSPKG